MDKKFLKLMKTRVNMAPCGQSSSKTNNFTLDPKVNHHGLNKHVYESTWQYMYMWNLAKLKMYIVPNVHMEA